MEKATSEVVIPPPQITNWCLHFLYQTNFNPVSSWMLQSTTDMIHWDYELGVTYGSNFVEVPNNRPFKFFRIIGQ